MSDRSKLTEKRKPRKGKGFDEFVDKKYQEREEEDQRRKNQYFLEKHKEGFVVGLTPRKSGSTIYCDGDGLWINSKKPLSPITKDKASIMIESFEKEDYENEKKYKV